MNTTINIPHLSIWNAGSLTRSFPNIDRTSLITKKTKMSVITAKIKAMIKAINLVITSFPKWSLFHAFRPEKTMSAIMTFESANKVIPFSSIEFGFTASRASKSDWSVQSRQLPPPKKIMTIVALSYNLSISMINYVWGVTCKTIEYFGGLWQVYYSHVVSACWETR